MNDDEAHVGPIMRLFQVRAKPGQSAALIEKFSTTSADVVRNEPGNKGYVFGRGVADDADVVIFASLWTDLAAVKERFGESWRESFLPEGYDDLIEDCSVHHIDVAKGWHAKLEA